jgi:hypothetical protein
MNCLLRAFSLAAATAIVAALSSLSPAFAAEETAASKVSSKALHAKHHAPTRFSRYVRPVAPAGSNLGCSGTWCGRQFVLIVGIGF